MDDRIPGTGRKFVVARPGCRLWGVKPIPGGQQGWGAALEVGTVLTCGGIAMSKGSDGVPVVIRLDENGRWIANDCEFTPSVGGIWHGRPDPECLKPLGALQEAVVDAMRAGDER